MANAITDENPYALIGRKLDRSAGQHLYRQAAELMRLHIRNGELAPGDLVPPQRELSLMWGIGEVTVRRAMQELAKDGLIEARAGGGTAVRAQSDVSPSHRSTQRALTIGIAFANLADGYPFFTPLLESLRSGGQPILVRLFDMPPEEQIAGSLEHVPPLGDFDGLIMMSPVNLTLAAACQQRRMPLVMLFGDLSDGYSHCIVPDYNRGIGHAVRHLASQGRRRIALVTAGAERYSTPRWIDAFSVSLDIHDLPLDPSLIIHASYEEGRGYTAMKQLLALDDPPDAVLFASDHMARGGLVAAHDEAVAVPQSLAIIGAGRILGQEGWSVPVSTIDLGLHAMGELAREAIISVIAGQDAVPLRQSVPTSYIAGATG